MIFLGVYDVVRPCSCSEHPCSNQVAKVTSGYVSSSAVTLSVSVNSFLQGQTVRPRLCRKASCNIYLSWEVWPMPGTSGASEHGNKPLPENSSARMNTHLLYASNRSAFTGQIPVLPTSEASWQVERFVDDNGSPAVCKLVTPAFRLRAEKGARANDRDILRVCKHKSYDRQSSLECFRVARLKQLTCCLPVCI